MPTVPLLTGTDVGTRPLPVPRVSPEMFGAAPSVPDTSGLADVAHAIWQEQKRKSDQVAVLGAATQVSDLETNLATETRARRGLNAYSAHDDVAKAWTDGTSKIGATLTNDDQRLAFQNVVASHGTALHALVQEHVAQQHKVVDDENTQGYTAAEANAALQNYQDPIRVAEAVANAAAAIRAHGQRNGEDPDYITAQIAEHTSKIHVGVIDRLLANDQDLAAKSYYLQYKDTIDAQQLPALDKALDLGSSRVASQAEADRIMKAATTRGEALDLVDRIENPKVQDLARQRVTRLWTQKEDDQRERAAATMQQATDIVRQTGDFNRVPPSMLVGMSVANQDALLSFAKKLTDGLPIKTDRGTFNDLQKLFANPETRDAALKLDLNRYTAKLSDEDFKHFSELQGGLFAKDAATEKKLNGIYTNDQIVESALKGAGLGTGLNPGAKKEDARTVDTIKQTIKQTINQQVEDFEQHAKRPATAKEVTEITNEILTQHIVSQPGRFFGRNETPAPGIRLDQMGPNDSLVVRAKDIKPADRQAIAQQLRAQGKPVTDDTIIAAYRQYLTSLRPRGSR